MNNSATETCRPLKKKQWISWSPIFPYTKNHQQKKFRLTLVFVGGTINLTHTHTHTWVKSPKMGDMYIGTCLICWFLYVSISTQLQPHRFMNLQTVQTNSQNLQTSPGSRLQLRPGVYPQMIRKFPREFGRVLWLSKSGVFFIFQKSTQ